MSKRDDFLQWLESQVGVTENPPGSNNVIYNTEYYGHEVSGPGYAWCATFQRSGLKAIGCVELYYGGEKTAYVPSLLNYYRDHGQIVTDPQPGDLIFYDWDSSGLPDHIGAVVGVADSTITTIEGNVGDAVKKLIKSRTGGNIQAYARLKWPDESEPQPDPDYVEPFVDVPKSAWYAKAVKWCYDNGVVTGTDKTHFSPKKTVTRAEAAQMLYKLAKAIERGGG